MENVAAHAMLNAFAHHFFVVFIAEGGCFIPFDGKIIRSVIAIVQERKHFINTAFFAFRAIFDNGHFIFVMVDDNDMPVKNVNHFGNIAGAGATGFRFDVFKIFHGVVGGVSEKTVERRSVFIFGNFKRPDKPV